MMRRLLALACLGVFVAGRARAQGVMLSGATYTQYIEMRPLTIDSVPFALTDSAWGSYRITKSGVLARCVALLPKRFGQRRGRAAMSASASE